MKKILKYSLYICFVVCLLESNVCIGQNYNSNQYNFEQKAVNLAYAKDENDVKATINHFLLDADDSNLSSFSKKMIGNATYTVHFSDGSSAFVKYEATSYIYGVPLSHNIDYFTLKKKDENWEIVNASFTSTPNTADKINFDLISFAKDYTTAWCSQNPDSVALFFAKDGTLTINNGKRSVGRTAIAKDAESFMNAFPDMVVSMDSLNTTLNGIEFHWTLKGTNTGANGKGGKIKISGFKLWKMDNTGLIKQSQGSFDVEEYNRQLKYSVDN